MKEKMKNLSLKLDSATIIAALFIAYIFYVGCSALPLFLENCVTSLKEEYTLEEYIDIIDEQYKSVLTLEKDNALLQNKSTYININGLVAHIFNQKEMNSRVLLSNGHLSEYDTEKLEIVPIAENIVTLYNKQIENNGNFLFVLAPCQVSKYENLLPKGYSDNANLNGDALINYLDEQGVSFLDLRESMNTEKIRNQDIFFLTDHHWTPEGAFWAWTQILRKLEKMEAISPLDVSYIDTENYQFLQYESSFLGSSGKRTGIYFAGVDDFTMILPSYETDIHLTIEEKKIDHSGPFADIAYRFSFNKMESRLINPDLFNDDPYGHYGFGNVGISHWRNANAPENQKFLLIGDSFGNIPFALMSLYATECDELDMRNYTDNFAEYFDSYCPDTVILLVTTSALNGVNATYPYFETT